MLKIIKNKKTYLIKNELSEFTLFEFEEISHINKNTEALPLNKVYDTLIVCGATSEFLDSLVSSEFTQIYSTLIGTSSSIKFLRKKKIASRTFIAFEEKKFKGLKQKDLNAIERYCFENQLKSPPLWVIMAFLMKEENKTDHHSKAEIEDKIQLFKTEMRMAYAMPYIMEYEKSIIDVFSANINRNIK